MILRLSRRWKRSLNGKIETGESKTEARVVAYINVQLVKAWQAQIVWLIYIVMVLVLSNVITGIGGEGLGSMNLISYLQKNTMV